MRKGWVLVVMAFALCGCVHTRTMDFAVPAPELRTTAAWGNSVGVGVSVSDKRIDRTTLGKALVNNGATYIVQPRQGLEEALTQGIKTELQTRGVRLADGPAFLLVDISKADSITRISAFNIDVAANAEMAVQVLGADGRNYFQQTYRRYEAGKGEIWTMDTVEQGTFRLEKIMAELIREMIEDDRLAQALVAASRG